MYAGILVFGCGLLCSIAGVKAGQKSSDEEREKVGMLITNCTIFGTVIGNLVSLGIEFLTRNI